MMVTSLFRVALTAFCALALVACAGRAGGVNELGQEMPTVAGKYREGNLIRVHASMGRSGSPRESFAGALRKAAEMTAAKGFPRFAVVKVSECGTLMHGRTAVISTCRILARMLRPGEVAGPEGKDPVAYYQTSDVMAGVLAPAVN